MGTYTLLLLRLGLLAAIVAIYVSKLLTGLPLTTQPRKLAFRADDRGGARRDRDRRLRLPRRDPCHPPRLIRQPFPWRTTS